MENSKNIECSYPKCICCLNNYLYGYRINAFFITVNRSILVPVLLIGIPKRKLN